MPMINARSRSAWRAIAVVVVVGITTGIAAGAADAARGHDEFNGRVDTPGMVAARRRTPPERSVTIVSDSAMAGVRWHGALGGFRGFHADARLESCRRLVVASCRGREGYRPRTALEEVRSLGPALPTDVLVIAVGYNDVHYGFASQSRMILDAARAKGFSTVAWVTYRELVGYTLPSSSGERSDYAFMNRELQAILASGAYPELRIWDLDGFTRGVAGWFAVDGVHETLRGAWGVADWISRHVAALDGRPCPMPWARSYEQDQVCPNPDPLAYVRGWPDLYGLYGV